MSGSTGFCAAPIPSSVKVGYRVYAIELMTPRDASQHGRYGCAEHVNHVIKLDMAHPPVENANTLLHEIMHCVWRIWNIDDEDNEERTVSSIANGLATVWRENPVVFDWLRENLASK